MHGNTMTQNSLHPGRHSSMDRVLMARHHALASLFNLWSLNLAHVVINAIVRCQRDLKSALPFMVICV